MNFVLYGPLGKEREEDFPQVFQTLRLFIYITVILKMFRHFLFYHNSYKSMECLREVKFISKGLLIFIFMVQEFKPNQVPHPSSRLFLFPF